MKNTSLVLASAFTLFAGSLFAGFAKRTNDLCTQYLFRLLFFVSVTMCFMFFDVYLPGSIKNCECKDGYYGTECDGSCWGPNLQICNGNGRCLNNGCVCDGNFAGEFCHECINKYVYESECTRCQAGWSLTFRCTRCNEGRDKDQDCQVCLPSYWEDPDGVWNSLDG